jgi:uncharacterized protein
MATTQRNLQIPNDVQSRVDALDWPAMHASLNQSGWAKTGVILAPDECSDFCSLYQDDSRFRSKIVMQRHRFGVGEYKYFKYPLPELITELRQSLYPHLAPLANEWMGNLDTDVSFPSTHQQFIKHCHVQGQSRPTPLVLRYETGGYNCLHQDLYGAVYFPFQTVFLLNQPEQDFDGGEFILVEQRPRSQSAAQVLDPALGEGVIFTTRWRPVRGTRGYYRVNVRHGVSPLTRGIRHTLGIVYHDAE